MQQKVTIKQGETAEKIAQKHGMTAEKLWQDSDNKDIRADTDNPDILMPGQTITIPEPTARQESIQTESKHQFRKLIGTVELKIQLMEDDEPRDNLDYVLKINGKNHTGTTDDKGFLIQKIPATADEGLICIGETEEIPIKIGAMDPVTELSGAQKRLENLGYDCGGVSDEMNETTEAAIRAFQTANEIEVTGQADQATQDKLVELHGC